MWVLCFAAALVDYVEELAKDWNYHLVGRIISLNIRVN